jgi:hypothetical protein
MNPWILRAAILWSLLGALWISAPNTALARPFPTDPGPTESGDPTADDQPSPTPKPKVKTGPVKAAAIGIGVQERGATVRVPWEVYLRLVARYWAL